MKTASRTDAGKVRTNNEDSIFVDQERGIFLLADGMGGHNAGEVASRLAVDTVHDYLKDMIGTTESDDEILQALDAAVMKANEAVKEKASSDINLRGMGTTLVVLVIKKKKAYLCHAGDSRAYLFRGKLKRLTKDHTVGDSYVEKGYMTREQVPPQQWHTLTQSVGIGDDLVPDKKAVGLKPGDILLLCSDGLTNMLTDEVIAAMLTSDTTNINEIADSLVAETNKRGGRDNISLILVAIYMAISDKPNWHDNDKEILAFQKDYPDIYAGLMKMLEGNYDSDQVKLLIDDFPDIYDGIFHLVENGEDDENVRILGEDFPEVYSYILHIWKKWENHRTPTPTPQKAAYKKGDFIGQKYEVYDVLGEGGFGIVYLVYSHETKNAYALKTFKDEFLNDIKTRERFKKEAQVWIDLERHPYIVRAYFVDEISGRLYIAMEHIASDEPEMNTLSGYLESVYKLKRYVLQ